MIDSSNPIEIPDGGGGGNPTSPPDPDIIGELPDNKQTNGNLNADIKIGITEKRLSNFIGSHLKHLNWSVMSSDDYTTVKHATNVLRVLVNSYPNYQNYTVFAASTIYYTQLIRTVDWMVEKGVNIVNLSTGVNERNTYDSVSRALDYIAEANNILIVAAASNIPNLINTIYTTAPGVGYNVISVGAVNASLKYENKSSYKEITIGNASKPNFVDNFTAIGGSTNGTSSSTPRVTAKIAKLLYEYPTLRNNLPLLLSVIHAASATSNVGNAPSDYKSDGFEDKIGVGVLNIEGAQNILSNNRHHTFTVSAMTTNDFAVAISVPTPKRFYFSAATLNKNSHVSPHNTIGYLPIELVILVGGVEVKRIYGGNILYGYVDVNTYDYITIRVNSTGMMNYDRQVALSWRY